MTCVINLELMILFSEEHLQGDLALRDCHKALKHSELLQLELRIPEQAKSYIILWWYLMMHIGFKIEEETSKMLHLEHSFGWC